MVGENVRRKSLTYTDRRCIGRQGSARGHVRTNHRKETRKSRYKPKNEGTEEDVNTFKINDLIRGIRCHEWSKLESLNEKKLERGLSDS